MTTIALPHDPSTPLRSPLEWEQTSVDAWRSVDGAYLIAALTSPDRDGDLTCYQLRGTDHGGFGYYIEEVYDLRQAMEAAVRHRYCRENAKARSVPADYDAEQVARFFWPISDGTTRGALVITHDDDGRRIAAVVGMSRGDADPDGECRFQASHRVTLPVD